jgi:hypothetical protein
MGSLFPVKYRVQFEKIYPHGIVLSEVEKAEAEASAQVAVSG